MDVGEAAEQQAADSTSDSEGGPSDDVHGAADPQAPIAGLSKNAQKKLRKQAEWELKKAQRKVEGKARRRADRARWVAEKEQLLGTLSEEQLQARREASQAARAHKNELRRALEENKAAALSSAWTFVIDCGLSHLMSPKEVKSMMHQFAHCYSANSKAACCARLCFTHLTGDLADAYDKYPGTASWPVLRSGDGLGSSFKEDASRLVYLTADSPNELAELSQGDIYVIGGLVDRNRHKGITLRKAEAEGIRHARLPLQQHCKLAGSAVLTVNQVVDILLAWLELRDWRAACLRAIPPRKRVAEEEAGMPAGAADGASDEAPHSGADGPAAAGDDASLEAVQ